MKRRLPFAISTCLALACTSKPGPQLRPTNCQPSTINRALRRQVPGAGQWAEARVRRELRRSLVAEVSKSPPRWSSQAFLFADRRCAHFLDAPRLRERMTTCMWTESESRALTVGFARLHDSHLLV